MTHGAFRPITAAFVAALSFAVAVAQEPNPLEGTWIPAKAELAGKAFPEQVLKSMMLQMKGDAYTSTVGKALDRGTVKRNDAAMPKRLDIVGTVGPNKGKTILAIYERNGDTLRICYDLTGKAYPTEFKTSEGTQHFLVAWKRAQP
jgi:uncharacterized protein (TIGR03067 family)